MVPEISPVMAEFSQSVSAYIHVDKTGPSKKGLKQRKKIKPVVRFYQSLNQGVEKISKSTKQNGTEIGGFAPKDC